MFTVLLATFAIALAATVLALAREVRLRKALEKLLHIILSRWRAHVSKHPTKTLDSVEHHIDPDERLR
jgi:hypothetical protein